MDATKAKAEINAIIDAYGTAVTAAAKQFQTDVSSFMLRAAQEPKEVQEQIAIAIIEANKRLDEVGEKLDIILKGH